MDENTLAGIIGTVQGIRSIGEQHRDELSGDDLMRYALEAMESELFDLMGALIPRP